MARPLTPFPVLASWPYRPAAIKTPPRPVSAGPLIFRPENASCSRIPPRASRTSLPPRRWTTTCCRLSLRPCPAPLSCSLQPLLKLSLLSLGTISAPICLNRFTLAASQKPDLWTCVCVLSFPVLPLLSDRNELQLPVPVCNMVFNVTAIPLLHLPSNSVLAVSEILNHSDTCAVPSVFNAVGLLILLKLCPVVTLLQQLMTKGLWVIYAYACSPRFSIDVVTSAPDDPFICR